MTDPGVDWKTYVDTRIDALDKANRDRATDAKLAVEAALMAAEKAINAALAAAEKAVLKAETAQSAKNDSLNELRGMVADWRTIFALKDSVDMQFKGVEKSVAELKEQQVLSGGRSQGVKQTGIVIGAVIGGLGAIVGIAGALYGIAH